MNQLEKSISLPMFLILYPIILMSLFENLSYGKVFMPYFILTIVVWCLFVFICFCLSNSLFLSGLLISTLWLVIYLVNYFRFALSGEFFTPRDLAMAKNLQAIASFDSNAFTIPRQVVILLLIFVFLQYLWGHMTKNIRVNIRSRMVLFSLSLLLFFPTVQRGIMLKSPVNTAVLYEERGAFLGFASLLLDKKFPHSNQMTTPPTDSYPSLEQVKEELENIDIPAPAPVKKPNVIVIMSEAFADPALWEKAKLTTEVIPNFNRLSERFPSGKTITPVLGGGTCNPEYELLTGYPIFNLPTEIFPFEEPKKYIPYELPEALPYQFKKHGYQTIGIHLYQKKFFNRHLIYPRLGFDKFIAIEDVPEAPIKGLFASDEYFTDLIIESLENSQDPAFIYGISMENHYGYFAEKFKISGVLPDDVFDARVYAGGLNDLERGAVTSYLQGLHDADKALGQLIDYLEDFEEPTMVLFFGDHQPLIGSSPPHIMYQLGVTKDQEPFAYAPLESRFNLYQTPYLFWANYDLLPVEYEYLSPYHFGPILLEQAGLEMSDYFKFLLSAKNIMPGAKHYLYIDKDGNYTQDPTPEMNEVIYTIKLFQQEHAAQGEKIETQVKEPPRKDSNSYEESLN